MNTTSVWKHQKTGRLYTRDGLYTHEATGETLIAYTCLETRQKWVRPITEWHEIVVLDERTGRRGPRFIELGAERFST